MVAATYILLQNPGSRGRPSQDERRHDLGVHPPQAVLGAGRQGLPGRSYLSRTAVCAQGGGRMTRGRRALLWNLETNLVTTKLGLRAGAL